MKRLIRRMALELKRQGGVTLLETVVGVGILGLIGVAFMLALSVGQDSSRLLQQQVTGENLVRAQLEDIRNQPYAASYNVSVTLPEGYTIAIDTDDNWCAPEPCVADGNIQKNTVTVYRDGKTLVKIEDLKTNRGP
ncbi:hypothetical protein ACFLVI_02500 [Chloroflexota bacterium]